MVATRGMVYLSRDDGATWSAWQVPFAWETRGSDVPDTFTATPVSGSRDADVLAWWVPAPGPLAFDASSRKHFSCVSDAVYVSDDRGRRWTRAGLLPQRSDGLRADCRTLHAAPGELLHAGTSTGVRVSADAGKTWSSIDHAALRGAAVDFMAGDDSGAVYLNARSTALPGGKASYKITNAGRRWSAIDWPQPAALDPEVPGLVGFVGGKLYASLRTGLFVSSDGARTWSPSGRGIARGSPGSGVAAEVVTSVQGDRTRLYALTARQVYKFDAASGAWSALGRKGIPER